MWVSLRSELDHYRKMYSKEEFKQLKLDFWSGLERELKLIKNPHGSKVNWTNYNTKINHLYFRMEVDDLGARLCIDMQQRDEGIRELLWDQFLEFETKLNNLFESDLIWEKSCIHTNGLEISRISIRMDYISFYDRGNWPAIYEFMKTNFSKLNKFWFEFEDLFKSLMN